MTTRTDLNIKIAKAKLNINNLTHTLKTLHTMGDDPTIIASIKETKATINKYKFQLREALSELEEMDRPSCFGCGTTRGPFLTSGMIASYPQCPNCFHS